MNHINIIPILNCLLYIAYYILLIHFLFGGLDAHMLSHNGYGPGTNDQGPKAAGPVPGGQAAFGPWSLVPGPYPLYLNICASRAISRQSVGNQ